MKKKYRSLSGFAILVIMLIFIARIVYDHKIEEQVQSRIKQVVAIIPWVKISYESLDIKSNSDVILRNLKIDNSKSGRIIMVSVMTIHRFDSIHRFPQYLDITLEKLQISVIPVENPREDFIGFTQLGEENLLLSLSLQYEYDDFSHVLNFNSDIDVKNIARIGLNLKFANVDYEQIKYYRTNMAEILLIKGLVSYTEKGILSKFLSHKAKSRQQTETQLLMQMNNKLDLSIRQAKKNKQQNMARFYQAVKFFLQRRHSLKISVNNERGVSFKKINSLLKSNADREKLASLMNVKLTN